jgi:hypothetical protein
MIEVKNPFQLPRLQEILEGKKFWGYLDTEALQTRYVIAAHFLRDVRSVVEIGGYRNNVITRFLTGSHQSVTVYSLDAEFEALEQETLNEEACRVRHIKDYFQGYSYADESLGVVALGLEIFGDLEPFYELMRRAKVAVIEIPVDHAPSVECLNLILKHVEVRVVCQINLDFSPNEALLRDELLETNMNVPFWKRHMYILEPANAETSPADTR